MNYFKITDDGKLTTSQLLNKCRNKFPVWSYYSDKELDKQFPAPKEETTRYFLKSVEPDKEHLGKSVDDCKDMPMITLRERIIMELQYFKETGKHLDGRGWTRCGGSRFINGSVPGSRWYCGGFRVGYSDPDDRSGIAGPREAFLTIPSPLTPQSLEDSIKAVKEVGYIIYKPI